jgi:hypothetical protein
MNNGSKKVKLDLLDMDGNAMVLISAFVRQAKREGWTQQEIIAVTNECMSGDYDHLLQTLMEHTES